MWIVYSHRSSQSVFGASKTPLQYGDGTIKRWEEGAAKAEATRLTEQVKSTKVWYTAEEE